MLPPAAGRGNRPCIRASTPCEREALRLRVKDVDFNRNQITVRSGKGGKDRVTMLPAE